MAPRRRGGNKRSIYRPRHRGADDPYADTFETWAYYNLPSLIDYEYRYPGQPYPSWNCGAQHGHRFHLPGLNFNNWSTQPGLLQFDGTYPEWMHNQPPPDQFWPQYMHQNPPAPWESPHGIYPHLTQPLLDYSTTSSPIFPPPTNEPFFGPTLHNHNFNFDAPPPPSPTSIPQHILQNPPFCPTCYLRVVDSHQAPTPTHLADPHTPEACAEQRRLNEALMARLQRAGLRIEGGDALREEATHGAAVTASTIAAAVGAAAAAEQHDHHGGDVQEGPVRESSSGHPPYTAQER